MSGGHVCIRTFWTSKKPLTMYIESLWNIMRSNKIPEEMVRVIVGIYMGFECAVVDTSVTSAGSQSRMEFKWGM